MYYGYLGHIRCYVWYDDICMCGIYGMRDVVWCDMVYYVLYVYGCYVMTCISGMI